MIFFVGEENALFSEKELLLGLGEKTHKMSFSCESVDFFSDRKCVWVSFIQYYGQETNLGIILHLALI